MENVEHRVTAGELFAMLDDIVEQCKHPDTPHDGRVNSTLHQVLVLCCHEGVRDTDQAFGNLFAQVDFLCKHHHISIPHRIAIQEMRRHSNHVQPLTQEQTLQDVRALALLIGKVFGTGSPYPAPAAPTAEGRPQYETHWRGIVESFTDTVITLHTENGGLRTVDYSAEHLHYLRDILHPHLQLNISGKTAPDGKATEEATLIVVEPDYLIDISRIAACFEQHGHHPLNYLVNLLKPAANTQAILLGNLAGSILDDTINAPQESTLNGTIRQHFRDKILEFCTCGDFSPQDFKIKAQQQAENIRQAVEVVFGNQASQTFDREKAILEPSFVCESLGISGRVDLMTSDFRLLVEQKSGKNWNLESGLRGAHGSYQLEPHYVQLLLYYGVLQHNFHLSFDHVSLRLLYSKYPARKGLVVVNYLQKLFREAIEVRNRIVDTELQIARKGFAHIRPLFTPQTLNVNNSTSTFYTKYRLPEITAITAPIHTLEPLERAYFERMMTFVYREQRVSKLGSQEGVSSSTSDLWNMPLREKQETGNILLQLKIEDSDTPTKQRLVTLHTPQQTETTGDAIPNFRRGDLVYLYAYAPEKEPDVRQNILHKGNLVSISSNRVEIALNEPQALDREATYAVEHASSDSNTAAAIRSLHEFITADAQRKALLLGQREPRRDETVRLTRNYHPDYDEVILRAKQARDYFLLVGPPGTGKTSMALQFLVREELAAPGTSVLLSAYTNRAVDEICGMLTDNGIDYLRLGSEYSCEPRFRTHLLDEAAESHPRLNDIKTYLENIRVVVATTSMLQNRPYVFAIKQFSLAVVDEASQILEPNIIGLLSKAAISRFVLVGDHKQLPAVVQQSEHDALATEPELHAIGLTDCRRSLFERLLNWERTEGREQFTGTLRKQGRMHPDIAEWPNRMFYRREQLQPVPLPHQLEVTDRPRLCFIPSQFCLQPGQSDKTNTDEARIVSEQLKMVYEEYGEQFHAGKTVGVIVPYRNQIAMIRQEIEKTGIAQLRDVSIDTVERYQGSQRDVIIYSFTVQRPCQLAFLTANTIVEDGCAIDRKLNVALTRARKRLILTGNETVLCQNTLFRQLIEYIKNKE